MNGSWIALIPIILTVVPLLLIFSISNYYEKQKEVKQKMHELNKLYECPNCKKYHRKYQEIVKELSDENYKKIQTFRYEYKDGK